MSNLKLNEVNSIQDQLEAYAKVTEELNKTTSQYEVYLTHLETEDRVFKDLKTRLEQHSASQAKLKKDIDSYVRSSKMSVKSHGVSVNFSDPQNISYDLPKLLELYPEAEDIPRLITKSVDVEVMTAAVAAGLIPDDVEVDCKVETPKYRAGRVSIKVLKES